MRSGRKPFNAAFDLVDRYRAAKEGESCQVLVGGVAWPGWVLGFNGARRQVRFVRDGRTYVQWFDAADVLTEQEREA